MAQKYILFIVVSILAFTAKAQFEKGSWLISGSGDFNLLRSESSTEFTDPMNGSFSNNMTYLNLDVSGAYFFADRLAGGVNLGARYTFTNNFGPSFAIAPMLRYYTSFGLFGKALGGAEFALNDGFEEGPWIYNVGVGYAWLLNEHIAIEPALVYARSVQNTDDTKRVNSSYGLDVSITLFFGGRAAE